MLGESGDPCVLGVASFGNHKTINNLKMTYGLLRGGVKKTTAPERPLESRGRSGWTTGGERVVGPHPRPGKGLDVPMLYLGHVYPNHG